MSAPEIIATLAIVGFALIAAEVFVPGLVLGLLGGLSLIVSVTVAYYVFGLVTGTFVLAGISLIALVGFLIWMAALPHTFIGRRIMLQKSLVTGEGEKSRPAAVLLGVDGKALTPLRPAGSALIEGRKVDVVAEGELIQAGAAITVVREEGIRLIVRKSSGSSVSAK